MDFRYASVIKTFQTIKDFKPDGDPSLSIDALLDSPSALIGEYSLQLYDDEIAAAVVHTDIRREHSNGGFDEGCSESDFIDPNTVQENILSEDLLSEIELKFDDIAQKLQTILSSIDLRLYADNRPALKKALYADMFSSYFAEYEYLPQDIRTRLSAVISAAVDGSFRNLSGSSRISSLFAGLLQTAGPLIDSCIGETDSHPDRFKEALMKTIQRQYIMPFVQSSHCSSREYEMICKMMRKYILQRCKQNCKSREAAPVSE